MKTEGRPFAKSGLDISNYNEIGIAGRKFIIISTTVFYQILNSVLIEACEKYPEYFGKDDVSKVLEALYRIENIGTMDQFSDFLKTEQFAWILELVDEMVSSHVLRVELFRKVNKLKNDQTKNEFTGGVFHSFKHFTYKGIPLSTKKENKEINHPKSIIEYLIQGFFFSELKMKSEKKYESKINFSEDKELCFSFYRENVTGIYFVNSVIYKSG
ncbi:hypothetical protein [uncultured Draconibacterium sp.]|uniref:hypothetical protein n=1 Tax=uncultured Draconibacterium sp. TaxID=1573823 RepID=UPI0029C91F00|nr:hypothetical protein [uncultured Draconibacterium sp.]